MASHVSEGTLAKNSNSRGNLGQRLWQWIRGNWISEVPGEMAVCEFECREGECQAGDWESCDRRLSQLSERSESDIET